MSPRTPTPPKPAATVQLRALSEQLDAMRMLFEQDAFYATDAGYSYIEAVERAARHLCEAADEAIGRQLAAKAG